MAEKRYEIVTYMSPRKKLRFPEIEIVWYGLKRNIPHWNLDHKLSRFWEIYWNDTPGAVLQLPDGEIEMTPDVMVLVPPGTLISGVTKCPFIHNFVEFRTGAPFEAVKGKTLLFSAEKYAPEIQENSSLVHISLALYSLVCRLLAQVPQAYHTCGEMPLFEQRIVRVMKFMEENPLKKYSLSELAALVNLSESRFCHLFKKETGISPREYWLKQRVTLVLKMLDETTLSIPEIAEAAGFTDRSHLSRIIKAKIGLTPAQIRKNTSSGGDDQISSANK